MLKYMLDTNIVIYVIKRRPIEALDTFNKEVATTIATPAFTAYLKF
jgi:tRNA(fMet)-specific endonuclease VapC